MFSRELAFFTHPQRKPFLPLVIKRFEEDLKSIIIATTSDDVSINFLTELVLFDKSKTQNTQLSLFSLNWSNSLQENELSRELKLIIIHEISVLATNRMRNNLRHNALRYPHWNEYYRADLVTLLIGVKNAPQKIDLIGSHDFLSYFDDDKWLALFQLIKLAQVKRLILHRCEMDRWGEKKIAILCRMLSEGELKELNLDNNFLVLDNFGIKKWKILCAGIKSSKLEELSLCSNSFSGIVNSEYWDVLSQTLMHSTIQRVKLGGNLFANFNPSQWLQFTDVLKKSKLTYLSCSQINFSGSNTPPLFAALACSHLLELNFDGCDFNQIPSDLWVNFGDMLKLSKIETLSLVETSLSSLKEKKNGWSNFCTSLCSPYLKKIDLKDNKLNLLSPQEWKEFGTMLKSSSIFELNMEKNHVYKLNKEQWSAFKEALSNTSVTSLILNEPKSIENGSRRKNHLSEILILELNTILDSNQSIVIQQDKLEKEEEETHNLFP